MDSTSFMLAVYRLIEDNLLGQRLRSRDAQVRLQHNVPLPADIEDHKSR